MTRKWVKLDRLEIRFRIQTNQVAVGNGSGVNTRPDSSEMVSSSDAREFFSDILFQASQIQTFIMERVYTTVIIY